MHHFVNKPDFKSQINNQKGQSFVEFMFLLLVLLVLSFTLILGLNKGVGKTWKKMITTISAPTTSTIEF